jgi:hypothetical protein
VTLYELLTLRPAFGGADRQELLRQLGLLKESRTQVLCVLALNDAGKASYDKDVARKVAALDIPTFAATPNKLVEAVERALRGDVTGAAAV